MPRRRFGAQLRYGPHTVLLIGPGNAEPQAREGRYTTKWMLPVPVTWSGAGNDGFRACLVRRSCGEYHTSVKHNDQKANSAALLHGTARCLP